MDATVAIIVAGIGLLLLIMGIGIVAAHDRLDKLTKRFDEHGHNTSAHGGTTYEPVGQKEVSFEQLVGAIRSVQNQGAFDAKAIKGLIDAANES